MVRVDLTNGTQWLSVTQSVYEWLQDSYLETGFNWLTIAAIMQWHAEFIADTLWQQILCPSLSEPQIINAFISHYISAATATEARISFELRPTISWLSVFLASAVHVCVLRYFKNNLRPKIVFSAENEKTKMKNALSAENENGRKRQK